MPRIEVRAFCNSKLDIPIMGWLGELAQREPGVFAKCLARIKRLAECGHDLRRPESAPLRDGIHELRVRRKRVNYRILYFFHDNKFACLSHGIKKEAEVPDAEIERAISNKRLVRSDPDKYTTIFEN